MQNGSYQSHCFCSFNAHETNSSENWQHSTQGQAVCRYGTNQKDQQVLGPALMPDPRMSEGCHGLWACSLGMNLQLTSGNTPLMAAMG